MTLSTWHYVFCAAGIATLGPLLAECSSPPVFSEVEIERTCRLNVKNNPKNDFEACRQSMRDFRPPGGDPSNPGVTINIYR